MQAVEIVDLSARWCARLKSVGPARLDKWPEAPHPLHIDVTPALQHSVTGLSQPRNGVTVALQERPLPLQTKALPQSLSA